MSLGGSSDQSRRETLRAAGWVSWSVGLVLVLALVWQNAEVYFTIGEIRVPTRAQETRYLVTAGACIAAMVAALVVGLLVSASVLGRLGALGVLVALVVSLVFAVPHGRWWPDPAPAQDLPGTYTPCFSGSQGCGPGG